MREELRLMLKRKRTAFWEDAERLKDEQRRDRLDTDKKAKIHKSKSGNKKHGT